MKLIDNHNVLFFFLFCPLFLLSLAVAYFFKFELYYFFRFDIFFLFLVVMLAFLPQSKLKSERRVFAFKEWLGLVGLLQVTLFCLSGAIHHLIFTEFPLAMLPRDALWDMTHHDLFPWGFYTCCAVAFMYVGYCRKKGGRLSHVLAQTFKNKPNGHASVTFDFSVILLIFVSLVLTFSFVTLIMAFLFEHFAQHSLFMGKRVLVLVYATILIVLVNNAYFMSVVRFCLQKKIHLTIVIMGFMVLLAGALFLLSETMQHFLQNSIRVEHLGALLNVKSTLHLSVGLMSFWWLSLTPVVAGYIAYVSQGYSLRHIILATLVLPVTFAGVRTVMPRLEISHTSALYIASAAAVIASVIFLKLFFDLDHLDYLRRAILPGTQNIKARGLLTFLPFLFRSMTLLIMLFLPMGVIFPMYTVAGLTLVPIGFFVVASIASIVIIVRKG